MRLKDWYLSMLSESENHLHLDNDTIDKVNDVEINKAADKIKITFQTTYEKEVVLTADYSQFKKWFLKNVNKHPDMFKAFTTEFVLNSQETEAPVVNEIIDDEGNIMPSTDMPKNATNQMVGSNNTWDLEKLGKSQTFKSNKYFTGGYGGGFIVWTIFIVTSMFGLIAW
jgi:hypothetical protein